MNWIIKEAEQKRFILILPERFKKINRPLDLMLGGVRK